MDLVDAYAGRHPRLRAFDDALADGGYKLVVLLRMCMPHNLLNYGLAASRVRLGDFTVGTMIGGWPLTVLFCVGGARAAHGYQVKGAKLEPAAPIDMAHPYAAGSLCSTAPDLVAWMKALAHGQIVDEAAWKRMPTPVTLGGGKTYPYGFGLFTGDLGGHAQIGHGGGINGFVSALSYFPDDDLYVAVLVDTESGLADSLAASIARTALGVKEKPLDDLPIPAADAARLAGRYSFPDVGLVLVVTVDGEEVFAQNEGSGDRRRLHLQADGTYVIPEAHAVLKFELDGDHAKSLDVTQGGVSFTGARLP
jgi:hypothetical protein